MFKLLTLAFFSFLFAEQEINLQNCEQIKTKIVPLLILNVNINDQNIIELLKKDLMMSGQFEVEIKSAEMPKKVSDITQYFDDGYSVINFLNISDDGNYIESRIYDTAQGLMVKGFKIDFNKNIEKFVHQLASKIWFQLTGEKSCFNSKIAYVKKVSKSRSQHRTQICFQDLNGEKEFKIVDTATVNVKPQWNNDKLNPGIWYSEFTKTNVRLMFSDLHQNRRIVFNFDGTLVGISCLDDEAVYCRSGNIWHFKYDDKQKKAVHTKLISMQGTSSSPNFTRNNSIVFACDFEDRSSRICIYDFSDGQITTITNSGYCVAPCYSKGNNKIVYCKKDEGVMQLMLYDMNSKIHEQLTFDSGNKIDPCWSPCGNYVVFCFQTENLSRVKILNIRTKKSFFITSEKDLCSYPAWSEQCDNE
ncbi:hypothetical protein M1446_01675 [Candidatus Dependentiae bacterium]|nr:hypothetical protein [Candidatus Dependentiae bacterium]